LVDELIDHVRTTKVNGRRVGDDPDVRRRVVEAYITAERIRLIGLRNYWMRNAGVKQTYEGSQFSLTRKMFMPALASTMLEVLGPLALIKDRKWAPGRAQFEDWQRASTATHPGGTIEVQKVIMARQMGLSRVCAKVRGRARVNLPGNQASCGLNGPQLRDRAPQSAPFPTGHAIAPFTFNLQGERHGSFAQRDPAASQEQRQGIRRAGSAVNHGTRP